MSSATIPLNNGVPLLGRVINFKDFLPQGVTVITHWMPWFGQPSHKNIPGYDSRDYKTCLAQCQRMLAMGIDAINVDWYGPDHIFENTATLRMLRACEETGMKFSPCVDKGSLPTGTEVPHVMQYINETFVPSDACLKDGLGRPFVNFFGDPGVDVSAYSSLCLLFQDAGGFSRANSSGAFGWVHPLPDHNDFNYPYLADFARAAQSNQSKIAWYPAYPGFDDSNASWGSGRLMSRKSGLTLLNALAAVPAGAKYVLIVTWNDHEEGSAIELSQG